MGSALQVVCCIRRARHDASRLNERGSETLYKRVRLCAGSCEMKKNSLWQRLSSAVISRDSRDSHRGLGGHSYTLLDSTLLAARKTSVENGRKCRAPTAQHNSISAHSINVATRKRRASFCQERRKSAVGMCAASCAAFRVKGDERFSFRAPYLLTSSVAQFSWQMASLRLDLPPN